MWTLCPRAGAGPQLRRRRRLVEKTLAAAARCQQKSDAELLEMARALKWDARPGLPTDDFLVAAFCLVREAARRAHGLHYYPTQLEAGVVLAHGGLAEMPTGEGKTLTALLPTFVYALAGLGAHVVTANDYLARRDSEIAQAVLGRLGLTVGCVSSDVPPDLRGLHYACDVTYGPAREFGFDYLRDCLRSCASAADAASPLQRERYFALVDEADSVLIDDARTPLVIAVGDGRKAHDADFYQWCHQAARALDKTRDVHLDLWQNTVQLTNQGCRRVLGLAGFPTHRDRTTQRTFHQVEQSVTAQLMLRRDRDYMVGPAGVEIIDGPTGRVSEGRKWRDGLQQAVEVKEGLEPTPPIAAAARVSVQSFYRGYVHLAGMTGTARPSAREFRRVYRLAVTAIPPYKPCLRKVLPPRIFSSLDAKLAAVSEDIARRTARGQAVLVGAPSVEASERTSAELTSRGIGHVVLNCLHHDEEAAIVSLAGQPGRVTVATNMAGRGTDIVVHPSVLAVGGLHVMATEMHASARIDRQLIGRTARQGQPGSSQLHLSLDDEIFAGFPSRSFMRAKRRVQCGPSSELGVAWLSWFRLAQKRLTIVHERERMELLRSERRREDAYCQWGLDPVLDVLD